MPSQENASAAPSSRYANTLPAKSDRDRCPLSVRNDSAIREQSTAP